MRLAAEEKPMLLRGAVLLTAGILLAAVWTAGAIAQIPPSTTPGGSPPCAASSPPPGSSNAPPSGAGPAQSSGQPTDNLSDKLARSEGVLCPPANLDPEMKAPTPDAGKTPVIPPPGSPGGDPNIRPK